MIEEAYALTQQDMGNAQMTFVEQTCFQSLLDSAGTVQRDVFATGEFPCFRNGVFNAIGYKVKM